QLDRRDRGRVRDALRHRQDRLRVHGSGDRHARRCRRGLLLDLAVVQRGDGFVAPPHPALSPSGGEGSRDSLSLTEGEGRGEAGYPLAHTRRRRVTSNNACRELFMNAAPTDWTPPHPALSPSGGEEIGTRSLTEGEGRVNPLPPRRSAPPRRRFQSGQARLDPLQRRGDAVAAGDPVRLQITSLEDVNEDVGDLHRAASSLGLVPLVEPVAHAEDAEHHQGGRQIAEEALVDAVTIGALDGAVVLTPRP